MTLETITYAMKSNEQPSKAMWLYPLSSMQITLRVCEESEAKHELKDSTQLVWILGPIAFIRSTPAVSECVAYGGASGIFSVTETTAFRAPSYR